MLLIMMMAMVVAVAVAAVAVVDGDGAYDDKNYPFSKFPSFKSKLKINIKLIICECETIGSLDGNFGGFEFNIEFIHSNICD